MLLWGAPVVHPDDPARAVRSALDMQAALVEFNRTREAEGLPPIHIGIGINTGELVAGYIGSTRTMSYSVIGDTVNTAARLCSAAKAGQVIISEFTNEYVKGEFDVIALDEVKVKGKAKALTIFNVVGVRDPKAADKTRPHIVATQRKL
jgi:adenylate cyclase